MTTDRRSFIAALASLVFGISQPAVRLLGYYQGIDGSACQVVLHKGVITYMPPGWKIDQRGRADALLDSLIRDAT